MNIGIDIDGTLTKFPEFFIQLGRCFKTGGSYVYIITGLGHEKAIEKMGKYPDDFFTELIDTSQYNSEEISLIGKVPNEIIVGLFKQRICREKRVSIMFDDQARIHRLVGDIPIFEVKK